MVITSIADIAGDNAVHALGTVQQARQLTLTAVGGPARFGDASVGAAQGVELPTGIPVTFFANPAYLNDFIQLSQAHAYIPSGPTLTISYGI